MAKQEQAINIVWEGQLYYPGQAADQLCRICKQPIGVGTQFCICTFDYPNRKHVVIHMNCLQETI